MSKSITKVEFAHQPTTLFPSPAEWGMLKEQAALVVKTGFLPKAIDTAEKAITIALKGRELGIPPMQAFSHIHVVNGKPGASAELMLSLIYRNCPGAIVNYVESNDDLCTIDVSRPGHKTARFSYSIDEARNAGLLNKDSWQKYAPAMLRARAVSIAARAVFPDAIMGCSYTPEELGAEVNDEGEVLELTAAPKPSAVVEVKKPEPTTAPAVRDRKVIGNEIRTVAADLGLTKEDIEAWSYRVFKVSGPKLSLSQMEEFLMQLKRELPDGYVSGQTS